MHHSCSKGKECWRNDDLGELVNRPLSSQFPFVVFYVNFMVLCSVFQVIFFVYHSLLFVRHKVMFLRSYFLFFMGVFYGLFLVFDLKR